MSDLFQHTLSNIQISSFLNNRNRSIFGNCQDTKKPPDEGYLNIPLLKSIFQTRLMPCSNVGELDLVMKP